MTITASNIRLDSMRFYAYHGVMEQEQRVGGYYLVSLTIETDLTKAICTDDVSDTVSYAELFELVKNEMAIPSKLLEHVAGRIGQRTLEQFDKIMSLTIRVTKENPPMGANCKGAAVELKLTR